MPHKDYEYEIQRKEKEIEKLKSLQEQEFLIDYPTITERPKNYEPNIFKACKEGKLTSVQWLIEKEYEDKSKRVEKFNQEFYEDDTPIHIASQNGHLQIVQYLIEEQNVDKDIKGNADWTPLHYVCWKNKGNSQFPIVKYLISIGANIEAKDGIGKRPLHCACEKGDLPIVKFLISKGAEIEPKDKNHKTPLNYASNSGKIDVVKFLLNTKMALNKIRCKLENLD